MGAVPGAGLLFACGAIHLDLHLTGYRSIPTIGGLFLLQIIVAFVLGVAVLASPRPMAVLVDARGSTLYWFVPDTSARSVCTGTCAAYWPPVTGSPADGPGVTGRLGTIRRSDGSTQVTDDGHPLYTYVADTSPGQARGNDISLNGGLWREMTPTG